MRYVSFYSGCGGLDLGTELAGFDPVLKVELDNWSVETLRAVRRKAGGGPPVLQEDMDILVTTGTLKDLRDSNIDLVVGGPPCQGFSVAGRMDPEDLRSRQVFTFLDAVRQVRPRAFIMENVAALTGKRWSLVLDRLRARAERSGYNVSVHVLDAAEFGVPQRRSRMFMTGLLDGELPAIPPGAFMTGDGISAGRALRAVKWPVEDDLVTPAKIIPCKSPVLRKSPYAGMLFNGGGRVINLNEPAQTLPATMGGNRTPIIDLGQLKRGAVPWIEGYHKRLYVLHGEPLKNLPGHSLMRRISVREALVLQGFDVNYPVQGPACARYRQVGNAVPPALSEAVSRAVRRELER